MNASLLKAASQTLKPGPRMTMTPDSGVQERPQAAGLQSQRSWSRERRVSTSLADQNGDLFVVA